MKRLSALILSLACTAPSFAWLSETSDHEWRSGWGQGVGEAEVTRGSGNNIYVACVEGQHSVSSSSISFKLAGDGPKNNSEVMLIFNGKQPITISTDRFGEVESKSHAGASVFEHLIDSFKKHNSVYVRFSDGREATFTLKGAKKAIGDCPSAFSQQ